MLSTCVRNSTHYLKQINLAWCYSKKVNESTPNRQREYQRRVIASVGLDPNHYEDHSKIWWRNPTNRNSLRLTSLGLKFFVEQCRQPSYSIALDANSIKNKHLLQLERLFTAPYFVKNTAIVVFNEQDAVMLTLHAGDLNSYLENLQLNS